MEVRKLLTPQEWLEAESISATAFLFKQDKEKSRQEYQAQYEGKKPRYEDAWGCFDETGRMCSSFVTYPHDLMFDGAAVAGAEINMVSSLPENRGGGNIREMMKTVLSVLREEGRVFATLHPFSFSFYRKFGFELASRAMRQEAAVSEFAGFTCEYNVRRVGSQEDVDRIRPLYRDFIRDKNLSIVREDKDWEYRGEGEFGQIGVFHFDDVEYSYLFLDDEENVHAYVKFTFTPSKENFIIGTMNVLDLLYDSPKAFKSVLAFAYGMRAKIATFSCALSEKLDLGLIVPNADHVKRTLSGHNMARVLNPEAVLWGMRQPEGEGEYSVEIEDALLAVNSGFYTVKYQNGKTQSVSHEAPGCGKKADLRVTVETFCQLAIGLADLKTALYRPGTELCGEFQKMARVFPEKTVLAD
ncbi:MAG: GNAT family N-acetyltransferase [Clostridia bacterium]|nr:GNAT family N-acetyltransferase [Clostridia bacterium]